MAEEARLRALQAGSRGGGPAIGAARLLEKYECLSFIEGSEKYNKVTCTYINVPSTSVLDLLSRVEPGIARGSNSIARRSGC